MKIVFITSRVPWPLEKGDKLRAYHQLKNLSKKNKIILCAINDTTLHPEAETELKKFCEEIHIYNISKFKFSSIYCVDFSMDFHYKWPTLPAQLQTLKSIRSFKKKT